MNPRQEKAHIKNQILEVLKRSRSAKYDVMVASFCLETGFNKKTIEQIFEDMVKVRFIRIDKGIITLMNKDDPL